MNCKVLLKHLRGWGISCVLLPLLWAVPLQLSLAPQFIQLLPLWKAYPSTMCCASCESDSSRVSSRAKRTHH